MSRMLNLRNILELVNNSFDNRTFARNPLISQAHQMIFHVPSRFGKKLNPQLCKQLGS